MANNVINIDKLKVFVLEQDINYRVLNGSISVYIGKYKNDKLIKRVYIMDIKENENVVGINFKSDGFVYKLLILPTLLDNGKSICSSKICSETASGDNKDKFIKLANLLFMEDTYEEKLVQHFLVMEMKESRNIYAESLANKNALYDSKAKIEHTFNNQKSYNTSQQHNASDLYFALSKVCTEDKIEHVSYDKIKQFSKQDKFIEAFKKLSECSIRTISLEGKWWTNNIGSFVAFKKNSHTAVAVVFKKNKYYAYEQNQTKGRILTKNYIDTLDTQAYSVNKTLPKRSLKTIDVFKYLKSVLPVKPLIGVLVMGLVMSIVGLLLPYLNRFIYDKYIPNQDLAGVLVCAFVLFSASVGNAFINVVKTISSAAISSKVNYSLQIAFFDRVFNLKESFIKQYEPAELSKRVMGISSIFTQISVSVFATIISFLYSFVYLFQMISFMPNLTWVAVLTSFVICAVVMLFVKMQNIWYKKAIDLDIKKSSILFQILSGINKIRSAGTEARLANLYIRLQSKCTIAGFRISMTGLLLTLFTTIFSTIASVAFYSILYMDGFNASLGSFMGFVSAFGLFSGAINQLPSLYSTYLQTKPWFTLLKPIIKQEPENSINSLQKIDLSGDIDIRHLSFSYSDNSDLILDDINLEIKKGEYVAIVGESGCGKTTLLRLLLGFEKPNSGKIFYSNHDFDSINKQVIRKNFGVVLQDGDLITGSIKDNLTAAYPQATQEEIINTLKQVDLWDDVSQMPMGIHTLLSGASGLISGGQKQRILIARAIISKPKILFLDEAISSLDNVSQAHVCESLDKIGCTRIVIAHRLSTIISCDKIYVLDNGKIVQSGTYEELSNTKGKFLEFIKRQIL